MNNNMHIERDILSITSATDIAALSLFNIKIYSKVNEDLTICGYGVEEFFPLSLSKNTMRVSIDFSTGISHYYDLHNEEVPVEYVVRDIFLNGGRLSLNGGSCHIGIISKTVVVLGVRGPYLESLSYVKYKQDVVNHFGFYNEIFYTYDEDHELVYTEFHYGNGLIINLDCRKNKIVSVIVGKIEDWKSIPTR
jgi:hypothetical protein